jgi:prolipoprotein diacylglyceryl transferase
MWLIGVIPPPPADRIEIGPLDIRFYGILIAIGVLIAITWTRRRYAERGGDPDVADSVALVSVALGFVGARLAYVLPRLGYFLEHPLEIFAVWNGGLALFGGLLLGAISVVFFLRRRGGDVPAFFDAAAPAVPLAQAIGRWGNYFNQELVGTPTTLPWALRVDPQFRPERFASFETFHPTFLYESIWNVLLVGFLLWLDRRKVLPRGALALVYAIGYAVMRFLLELIRTDTTWRFIGLSRNAWVSLAIILLATAGLFWWARRRPSEEPVAVGGATAEAPPGEEPPSDDEQASEPVA